MPTQYPELFGKLKAPFEGEGEVKIRKDPRGAFRYITARTAMNRLDEVLGPENWWDEYDPQRDSVLCRLTIRLPDGSLLTKMDAGGYAGMKDPGDDDKSGVSDAFKRACVKFGIARYLYRDGVPDFDPVPAILEEIAERKADEPTKPSAAGTPIKDNRPFAEFIPAGIAKTNADYAKRFAAREIVNPFQVVNHLYRKAVEAGHLQPVPKISYQDKIAALTALYGADATHTWIRRETKIYLGEVLTNALAKAEADKEPLAARSD